MSRESDMTAFIAARLIEAERDLHAMTSGPLVQGYLRTHGDQLKAQIAAMRKLMLDHVGYYGPGDDEYFPIPTLSTLAAIWDDHEDYADAVKSWQADGDA